MSLITNARRGLSATRPVVHSSRSKTIALDGVVSLNNIGVLSFSAASKAISKVSATGAIGTLTVPAKSVPLSRASAQGKVGFFFLGNNASGRIGSFTLSSNNNPLGSVSSTGEIGSLSFPNKAYNIIGNPVVTAIGVLVCSVSITSTVAATGVLGVIGTTPAGSFSADFSVDFFKSAGSSGVSLTLALPSVAAIGAVRTPFSGLPSVSATGAVGSFRGLVGVFATGAVNTFTWLNAGSFSADFSIDFFKATQTTQTIFSDEFTNEFNHQS